MQRKALAGLLLVPVVALSFAVTPAALAQVPAGNGSSDSEESPEIQASAAIAAIAVIDTQRVVAESQIGRGMTERVDLAAGEWERRVGAGRQELNTLLEDRARQALTLTPEAVASLDDRVAQKRIELQRLQEDARRDLAGLNQQLTTELNGVLGPSLESFARQRGIRLILDGSGNTAASGVLYFSEQIDVTADFIEQLDAAVAQWREVVGDDGVPIGRARISESDWLRRTVFERELSLSGR